MGTGTAQAGLSETAAVEHLCLSLPSPGWAQLDGTLDPLSSTARAYQEVRQRVHGRVLPKNSHKPLEGSAAKGKVLCVVRLVFNEAGNKLFWRCPWCPFSRDAPSSMHTHFERRHPALLGGISKVAYLRPCADRDGKVRAFLSGPTIGSFTNPRPLGPFPTGGQPSLCSSSQDEAFVAPSLKRHHESPSQPASKKQRPEQNEIGTGKLSAARPPQISPGKQAVQSIQERDAAESVHFLQSASRPREPLHGLQSPAKSRDGARSGHAGPGQAQGPREPLDGPESPARSREGVRSGHEGPGQAHASPEALHPLQPQSRSRDGMRSGGPGEAYGWHEAAKQAQHGSTAQRHAQLEYETTLLPPSQPLGLSSYLHGHHLHRDLRLPFQAAPAPGLGLRLVDNAFQGLMSEPSPSIASLEDRHNSSSSSQMPAPMLSAPPAAPRMDHLSNYDRLGKPHSRLSEHATNRLSDHANNRLGDKADNSLTQAASDLASVPPRLQTSQKSQVDPAPDAHRAHAELSSGNQPQPHPAGARAQNSQQPVGGGTPTAATAIEAGRVIEEQGPLPASCVGSLLEVLQGIQNLPSGLRPHRIDVSFRTGVLSVYPNDSPA